MCIYPNGRCCSIYEFSCPSWPDPDGYLFHKISDKRWSGNLAFYKQADVIGACIILCIFLSHFCSQFPHLRLFLSFFLSKINYFCYFYVRSVGDFCFFKCRVGLKSQKVKTKEKLRICPSCVWRILISSFGTSW